MAGYWNSDRHFQPVRNSPLLLHCYWSKWTIQLLQYTTLDTGLTHGNRKLRLMEEFEMLRLTPDFETLRLTCDFKALCLTPAIRPSGRKLDATFWNQASGGRFWNVASDAGFWNIAPDIDFKTLCLTPARRPPDTCKTPARCNFLKSGVTCPPDARQTPARCQPDAMFRNQMSNARFQNIASDTYGILPCTEL